MRVFSLLPLLIGLIFSASASAVEVKETFATKARFASGTLIWNQALGLVHPRNVIAGWNDGGGAQTTVFDVGDGSHGSFELSRYTVFDPNANSTDKIIRINTNTYPVLKVSKFILEENWQIIPTGTNPLVIYSLSDVVINGQIHCEGGNGGAPTAPSRQTPGVAGVGRCGGKNGGTGGAVYTGVIADANGVAGTSVDANVTGGAPGTVTAGVTTGAGGGGGGAFSDEPNLPNGGNGTGSSGGAEGLNFIDHAFTVIGGGAGGGGGSGSNTEAGAGGGAGGGVVIIHAVKDVTVGVNGLILAHGGAGGGTAGNGGAGGAGGGGSIKIFTSGDFEIMATSGTVIDAQKGTPGTSLGGGGNGGVAFQGRSWLGVGTFNTAGGVYLPSEDLAMTPGDGRYEIATGEVVSTVIDSGSSRPTYLSGSFSPVSAQVDYEVAGSDDGFVSDDSGWMDIAQISDIDEKRFFRFRITINNNNAVTPVTVTEASVSFDPNIVKEFEFKQAPGGCGLVSGSGSGGSGGPWALLLMLPLVLAFRLRKIIRT